MSRRWLTSHGEPATLTDEEDEALDYDATCDECELYLRAGHADDCSAATPEGSAGDD